MTETRHLSVVVNASREQVYTVAADLDRLPEWASGLASGITRDGTDVLASSPMGVVRVRFAPRNEWGVLDHDVELPDGTVVNNPVRVLVHPDGAEVLFTVRRLDMTEEQFDDDCATVSRDLAALKSLVENGSVGE